MFPLCQIMNICFLGNRIPVLLRPIIGIVGYVLLTPLILFMIPFIGFIVYLNEHVLISSGCISQQARCRYDRPCKFFGFLFVWIPFWTLIILIDLVVTSILFAILIVPGYIIGFFVILRMIYWWFKNKRLDDKNLTEKQLKLQQDRNKRIGTFNRKIAINISPKVFEENQIRHSIIDQDGKKNYL